jgi:hypothetical protein
MPVMAVKRSFWRAKIFCRLASAFCLAISAPPSSIATQFCSLIPFSLLAASGLLALNGLGHASTLQPIGA